MSRVAVHPNSSYRDSPPTNLPHYRPVGMEQKPFTKQPSRLQMLRADYQEKLQKEKEEKMIRMYEDQQMRALARVNQRQSSGKSTSSGLSAREFFEQRRVLEQKGYQSPPIEEHYRQAKRGHSSSSASSHASSSSRYSKNSAGKDRNNLLQPIDKKTPPIPTKPRVARQRPNNSVQARNNINKAQMNGNYDAKQDNSQTSSNDSTPPPNLQNLRNFQRKRLGAPPPQRDENEGPQKLTDFQRWQLEQNKAREQRLEKHRQSDGVGVTPGGNQWGDAESSDGDKENVEVQDALEEKQREIQEEIERHRKDLENLRIQKEREEEEEARQAEEDRKREAERQKRKRQQAAEEKKRRQEEEERERREEEDRRREERRQEERRREEEKRHAAEQRKQRMQQRRAPPPKQRTPSPVEEDDYQPPERNLDLYLQAAMDDGAQAENSVRLVPCKLCGRKFADERLAKHQAACKNLNKKRKVFDPTKMRTEGTEMAQYVKKGKSTKSSQPPKKKNNWRAQHESFIESIRYARKVTEMEAAGGNIANLPPPPKTENPDYVHCPKCNRKFNPTTAERHIPNCRAKPMKPRR